MVIFRLPYDESLIHGKFYFSLLSVMVNTPKQFHEVPSLKYVTYCVDIVCLIFFVAEMITKIKHMGLVGTEKVRENSHT